jgi:hypothetical protein
MQRVDEIAKRYDSTIVRFRGLDVATIPVRCHEKVDIGFSRRNRKLAGILPFLARRELRPDLYVEGKDVDRWMALFTADDALCSALSDLLKGYAYRIEWAGQRLSARVNTMLATIDGDETGGERFFAKLAESAGQLSTLSERNPVAMPPNDKKWGPATRRKFALACSFAVPFALLLVFHHFTARLAHYTR